MGLGKTLQMIALVASDLDRTQPTSCTAWKRPELACTLIVVPFPRKCLSLGHPYITDESQQCWRSGLTNSLGSCTNPRRGDSVSDGHSHVQPKTITWNVYHGHQRGLLIANLHQFNIVLTTYETIVSDRKRHQRASAPVSQQKTLFDIFWHRIIIDEGTPLVASQHFHARLLTGHLSSLHWTEIDIKSPSCVLTKGPLSLGSHWYSGPKSVDRSRHTFAIPPGTSVR